MADIIPFRPRFGEGWKSTLRLFWNASLNRLSDYLTIMQKETKMHDLKIDAPVGQPFLTMTRTFNAPRELVWKALSEPEHAVRWWGPHSHKNQGPRVGLARRRQVERREHDPARRHRKIVFFGEYLEIEKPVEGHPDLLVRPAPARRPQRRRRDADREGRQDDLLRRLHPARCRVA